MICSGGESEEVLPDGVGLAFLGEGAPLLEGFRVSEGTSVASASVTIF